MTLSDATTALICTTLGGIVLQVIGLYQMRTKHLQERADREQQRRWDKEDREEVAARLLLQHGRLAASTMATAERTAETLKQQLNVVETKIDENTVVNAKALDVANSVNEKILAIGGVRRQQTYRIETVVTDTNKVVHDIAPKIGEKP